MQWMKRRVINHHQLGTFRRRYDREKCFCICEFTSRFGASPRVLALRVLDDGTERIISRHRTVQAAERACERAMDRKKNSRSAHALASAGR